MFSDLEFKDNSIIFIKSLFQISAEHMAYLKFVCNSDTVIMLPKLKTTSVNNHINCCRCQDGSSIYSRDLLTMQNTDDHMFSLI